MGTKADTLAKNMGADLADSIGVRDDTGASTPPRDQFEGLARYKDAGLLLTSHICVEDQIRTEDDPEADTQLVESIRQVGLLQPIRVRWRASDGKWVVLVGHRRFLAAQRAGLERVPVICVTTDPTPIDVVREQIFENKHRSSLSAIDEAHAYKKYLDLTGEPAVNLANLLHISQATVSRALSLLTLPTDVQDAVAEEKISPKAAQAIAKIRNPTVQKNVATKAIKESLPAEAVDRTVRSRQGTPAKPSQQQQPFVQFKIARGTRVVIHGRLTGREVLEALRAAVAMAEAELERGEEEWEQDPDAGDES
jgi:ParB family transcriptional regulator, chromosome partitioning protein